MRFSEPPISLEAQTTIVNLVRRFLAAKPADVVLHIRMFKLLREAQEWIINRDESFPNYANNPRSARRRVHQLFGVPVQPSPPSVSSMTTSVRV
ncbi:hypothetical protein RB195_003255 [Necator americanus]|uniref:Uncharacterized protein n=1 Tax=Necator americanus TaxID=51031 RepID=A0ABR1DMR6_NECAM